MPESDARGKLRAKVGRELDAKKPDISTIPRPCPIKNEKNTRPNLLSLNPSARSCPALPGKHFILRRIDESGKITDKNGWEKA